MKKIIICGIICSTMLLGETITNIPVSKNQLSIENGGILSAVDSYSDGLGISFSGKQIVNNKSLNELVFKYGEKAKKENKGLKEYILNNYEEESDIEKANKLETLISKTGSVDGTICDDNDNKTINDIYMNGVCKGTNVEGLTCNDNDNKTINDIYMNGVCKGINISGLYFLSPNGINNGICSYEEPCESIGNIPSNSTIILKNGTYTGYFSRTPLGASANFMKSNNFNNQILKIIGEEKDKVIIDYNVPENYETRDRSLINQINNIKLMNMTIQYNSNSANTYSSAIISNSNNVELNNIDIYVTGIYSLNYNNYCPREGYINYKNVVFKSGTIKNNWTCSQNINNSEYQEGYFMNYL